jgi:hypothetical protein
MREVLSCMLIRDLTNITKFKHTSRQRWELLTKVVYSTSKIDGMNFDGQN